MSTDGRTDEPKAIVRFDLRRGTKIRALDKKGYLMILRDNFSYFSLKLSVYDVNPHLNHLHKMVQIRGHNMFFLCKINQHYP